VLIAVLINAMEEAREAEHAREMRHLREEAEALGEEGERAAIEERLEALREAIAALERQLGIEHPSRRRPRTVTRRLGR
jgi:hypothetical protein